MAEFEDYNSIWEGEEIDDAIAKLRNTGGTGTGKISYDQVGAAPAGFGWGDAESASISEADFPAWFDARQSKAARNSFAASVYFSDSGLQRRALMIATVDRLNQATVCRFFTVDGYEWQKVRDNAGVWKPLEWVNPPLLVGVEYRTTERYNGRPRFKQLVNCGALPNNTSKQITAPVSTQLMENVAIDFSKSTTINVNDRRSTLIPVSPHIKRLTANNGGIAVLTDSDLSAWVLYACIEYNKSTD